MKAKLRLAVVFVSLFSFAGLCVVLKSVPEARAASTSLITITSSPGTGSGYVTVDGEAVATPATFSWNVGDNHTIAANSSIQIVSGQSRYVYSSWRDGEEQSHSIVVPSQATTYTANFQLQYHLSVSGGNGVSYSNHDGTAQDFDSFLEDRHCEVQ
jgi:hypothetical protein